MCLAKSTRVFRERHGNLNSRIRARRRHLVRGVSFQESLCPCAASRGVAVEMSQWRSMSLNHYRNQRPSSSLMAPPSSPHPSPSPGPRRRLPATPDQMELIHPQHRVGHVVDYQDGYCSVATKPNVSGRVQHSRRLLLESAASKGLRNSLGDFVSFVQA